MLWQRSIRTAAGAEFLYPATRFRLGDRHHDHPVRRHFAALDGRRFLSEYRAAPGDDHRQLSRRQRRDDGNHRHRGHRAATDRDRQPALFQFDLGFERAERRHPDLRDGNQSRHRAGPSAEQGQSCRAAASATGHAGGRRGRQGDARHIDVHRVEIDQFVDRRPAAQRHIGVRDPAEHRAGERRRQHLHPRLRICGADLVEPRQVTGLRPLDHPGAQRGQRAERAIRRRLDRRRSRRQGPGLYRDRFRRQPVRTRCSSSATSSCAPTATARSSS